MSTLTTLFLATLAVLGLSSAMHHKGKGKGMMVCDYFMAEGEMDDCSNVPSDVKTGNVMMDACMDMMSMDTPCLCMKHNGPMAEQMAAMEGSGVNPVTGFKNVCGMCRDPCSLKFVPDMKAMMGMQHMMGMDSSEEEGEGRMPREFGQMLMNMIMGGMMEGDMKDGGHGHEGQGGHGGRGGQGGMANLFRMMMMKGMMEDKNKEGM